MIAEVFSLIVLLSDDYVRLKEGTTTGPDSEIAHFFAFATRLPMDLQMVISNRLYRNGKEYISPKHVSRSMRKCFREMDSQ